MAAHSTTGGGVGEHKHHDDNGRHQGACMDCMAVHNASIAISCKVGPFSGDATPPAESFLGFFLRNVWKDGDDVDEA